MSRRHICTHTSTRTNKHTVTHTNTLSHTHMQKLCCSNSCTLLKLKISICWLLHLPSNMHSHTCLHSSSDPHNVQIPTCLHTYMLLPGHSVIRPLTTHVLGEIQSFHPSTECISLSAHQTQKVVHKSSNGKLKKKKYTANYNLTFCTQ